MSYKKSIDLLKNIISYDKLQSGLDSLPRDINISTMTVCCNFNAKFNIKNIVKWLKLDASEVIVIGTRSFSNNTKTTPTKITKTPKIIKIPKIPKITETTKTTKISEITKTTKISKIVKIPEIPKITHLLNENTATEYTEENKKGRNSKNKERKKQKTKRAFYNQVSIKIVVPGKQKDKPVNVKLFNNGAVQMTGCVTLENSLDALYIAINRLNSHRAIIEKGKIKDILFSDKILDISDIYDYKIGMINSGFKVPFSIDRNKLLICMQRDNMDVLYDRNIHAGVIVKYIVNDADITMLVFEKGNVIITGAKDEKHISYTYEYINKYLLSNYIDVVKKPELSETHIYKYLQ
jgi:TATA-box binding protein (TBP) (component of TFIID and TFIIIB)